MHSCWDFIKFQHMYKTWRAPTEYLNCQFQWDKAVIHVYVVFMIHRKWSQQCLIEEGDLNAQSSVNSFLISRTCLSNRSLESVCGPVTAWCDGHQQQKNCKLFRTNPAWADVNCEEWNWFALWKLRHYNIWIYFDIMTWKE